MATRDIMKIYDEPVFEFHKRLEAYRNMKGWIFKELSDRSGISSSHLSNLENAVSEPGLHNLKALASAFNLTLDELVGDEDGYLVSLDDKKEDQFTPVKKFDLQDLALNLFDLIHNIDGIEFKNGEAQQVIEFARFLILRRQGLSEEMLRKVIEDYEQGESK